MSKLCIHIGTHKTGSTALQVALRRQAAPLRREGIVLLARPQVARPLMRGKAKDADLVRRCRDHLREVAASSRAEDSVTFVMSWEGFSGDPEFGYKNVGIVAESLRDITRDFDTQITVYLRRQDDFLESMYTQMIHRGGSLSFQEHRRGFSDSSFFNWQDLLERYAEAFGQDRIRVRRYHKHNLPNHNSLQVDFAQFINSQVLETDNGEDTRNVGYSRDALELARLTNPHLNDSERRRLRKALRGTSAKQPFEKYSYFSDADRKDFLSQYAESNAVVARQFLGDKSGGLFPPVDSDPPRESYPGLSAERAALVLAKAVAAMPQPKESSTRMRVKKRGKRALAVMLRRLPAARDTTKLPKRGDEA